MPDPNGFEGPVQIRRSRTGWEDVPYAGAGARDARGIGLHDLVAAIALDRPHRASAELAAHVVEVATSILTSGERGSVMTIESDVGRPDALPTDAHAPVPQP